jgi:hypothetical protein
MSADRSKFRSTYAFQDLLFNLLVGFVFLFVIAFILINPPTKEADAPKKAEYLIIIEWNTALDDDIDLWVKDPNATVVSFRNKMGGLLHLEKDDLGASNDSYRNPVTGDLMVLPINREVVTMRGIVPGRYEVAFHVYSRKMTYRADKDIGSSQYLTEESWVRASLVKINPYGEAYLVEKLYSRKGQIVTLFNFELDEDGNVTSYDERKSNFIMGSKINNRNLPTPPPAVDQPSSANIP